MTRVGGRVFTDFLIITPQQRLQALDAQIALVDKHYTQMRGIMKRYLSEIRALPFYSRLVETGKKLEHYFILHLFSTAIYTAVQRIVPSNDSFSSRPDGGAWIAIGNQYPMDFDFEHDKYREYCFLESAEPIGKIF